MDSYIASSKEDLTIISTFLRQHFPKTYILYSMIQAFLNEKYRYYTVYTDNEAEPSIVAVIPNKTKTKNPFFNKKILLFGENLQRLQSFAEYSGAIDWNTELQFYSLTEQQFSVLERTLKSHNDGEDLYPADKAFMFYVDSPDAILHVTKPIGMTSGPMTDKVMELAVSVWNFYEEGFEEYFKEIVSNNNPALCLYDKHGEPVGWVLQHMTGDIGLLYVVPEHRGKGYGKYLLSTMAKINCERNGFAFSFAQTWNEKSCRLHEFVGMKKHSDIYLKQHFRFNPENERLKIKTLPSSGNGIRQCTT